MVVFPGQLVPLHIFEPRYQRMIADVRAADERGETLPIGMILGQVAQLKAGRQLHRLASSNGHTGRREEGPI